MAAKKRKLRRTKDDELIYYLDQIKTRLDQHEAYLENSLDAGEDIQALARTERAKYWFLLREARVRGTTFY
ncbi:YaaL family protein [Alkalicoccus urumqiensis]|uniref:DUF2508 domain-containing protein n=1 Tax=Alkalicoccus urumqiensis TaxID=1548213 RepID=A0A2P6MD54_ALKUR|nr:YaaL family protein [Alkalicoccus urumqiensis]PRO64204.1 DUF2508 domain-containing protein [Alkalicoccus urumqiensis]